MDYKYLQKRRFHNLAGQPFPVLCHPQCKVVLSHVTVELLVFYWFCILEIFTTWLGQGSEQLYPTIELAVLLGAELCSCKGLSQGSWMPRSWLFLSKDQEDTLAQPHMKFLSPKEGKKQLKVRLSEALCSPYYLFIFRDKLQCVGDFKQNPQTCRRDYTAKFKRVNCANCRTAWTFSFPALQMIAHPGSCCSVELALQEIPTCLNKH